jgi:hypothetical protein
MAKTTRKAKKSPLYPWYELLELEMSKGEPTGAPVPAKRGRKSSGLPRKRLTIYQTPDQTQMMDEIIELLEGRLGRNISRGTYLSFLTVRLMILLKSQADKDGKIVLPESVKSLTAFADWLDTIE